MRRSSTAVGRAVAGALSLSLALVCAAPATAAETRAASGATVKTTLAASAARVTALSAAPRAFAQDAVTTGTQSQSFFKSRKGVIAAVLMIVGGGFTLYSVNHDREPVKSPIR